VLYLERTPDAPLNACVSKLWYTCAPEVPHARERVLPQGTVQVILNLARDFLSDCPEGGTVSAIPHSLVVGARAAYELVDTSDMAELIGIVFHPGGFAPFAADRVDLFSNRSIALDAAWGASAGSLRDCLRETVGPLNKLCILERFLVERFASRLARHSAVDFALRQFRGAPGAITVHDVARDIGWSERRFSQVFREQVGLTPKTWCRIRRFQHALRQLHAGVEIRWADLALDCGYYDQSHFTREFREFSGIDATTYSARRTRWVNHVPVDG
jgi:AraC-like DNA-binding protein